MSQLHWPKAAAAVVGALALSVALASPAAAQSSAQASIQAIADVQGVAPLTAAGVNNLNFGVVIAGTPTGLSNVANQAGRFNVTGEPNKGVSITMTLPTQLTGPGGPIPISFANNDGLIWAPFPTTFSTFDPNVSFNTSIDGAGSLVVGIRGTVSPPASTTTGQYTGTITMDIAYI